MVIGDRPMRRRLPAVEQAAFGEKGDTGADAGDVGAARVPSAQPGQQVGVPGDALLDVEAGGRNDDDVGLPDIADGKLRRDLQAAEGGDGAAVERGDRTRKRGCAASPCSTFHRLPAE